MSKTLENIESSILYIVVLLFPIVVIPISPNVFVVPKLAFLVFGVMLLFLFKAIRIIYDGKLDLRVGKYDLPVAVIVVSYLVSAFLRTPNKMDAFLLPGTATIVAVSGLLYFLVNQARNKRTVLLFLFLSGVLYSAISLLAFSQATSAIPQLPAIYQSKFFTPEGGYLPSALFYITLLPIGVSLLLEEKDMVRRVLFGVSTIIVVAGLLIAAYHLLPGRQFQLRFPSLANDWSIAVDALKASPFYGVGPGNYLTAFNRFRPLSYNTTELWAVKFTTSRSLYLTLLTETGLLGVAGVVFLGLSLYRNLKGEIKEKRLVNWKFSVKPNMVSLCLLIALLAFFPATLLTFAVFFIILASATTTRHTSLNLKTQSTGPESVAASRFPALILGLPIIVAVVLVGYNASKVLAAEYTFKRAVDALAQNKAQETYDLMVDAINSNPRVDRYHSTFAQVNLALANSIALKEEITDADRNSIAQLVQATIRESKSSVALNPYRAGNWGLLARTYQAIAPLAQGADVFAIRTYTQAIALDPINPNLRIGLGGIYYGQGDFDNAIRTFELAIAAKPDHANAHYNLAFALRESGDFDSAIQQMTVVLSLLDNTSNDYEVAKQALEDLQEKRDEARTGNELNPPQEAPAPVLQPPLELPEESEPPEAPPITSTPTPTPEEEADEDSEGTTTPEPTPTPAP